ncbi:DUF2752 domain-containing protein [Marinilabiliaceae bacterium JC017]|nr:DUF2752 domain-containing protein [Marinilabiliaceae bacterium JC017]
MSSRLPGRMNDYLFFQYVSLFLLSGVLLYPFVSQWGWVPHSCPYKLLNGAPCPSCGLTHSWLLIYQGKWHLAEAANKYGPGLWLFFALQWLARYLMVVFARKKNIPVMADMALTGILAFFFLGPYVLAVAEWMAGMMGRG